MSYNQQIHVRRRYLPEFLGIRKEDPNYIAVIQPPISHPVKQDICQGILSYWNSQASVDLPDSETRPRPRFEFASVRGLDSPSTLKPIRLLRGEITYAAARDNMLTFSLS